MRIDKFLKRSRLIKRRTVAKEACQDDKVLVNGRTAKPSKDVKVGDEIEIEYLHRRLKVKVEKIMSRSPKKSEASKMYSVLEEEQYEDF